MLSIKKTKAISVPDVTIYEYLCMRSRINSTPVLCRCHESYLMMESLGKKTDMYAQALYNRGIRKGDIVPICMEASIQAVVFFFALNRLGAVASFLNNTASTQEVGTYVDKFNAKMLLLSERSLK